jgi:signal transduction histidine kinase
VRRRIVVAIVSVTAFAVVLFAVPLAFTLANLYREDEVIKLAQVAAETSERIPASFPATNEPVELPKQKQNQHIALYDHLGSRIAGVGPDPAGTVVRRALTGDSHDGDVGDTLVVAAPVTRDQGVVGVIRVESPLSLVRDRTRDAIFLMFGIGLLVVAISAVIAIWQARRLARPVDRLARTASRLGDGDFTIHAETSGIAELDAVSRALDSTAARLDEMLTRERSFSEDASHQLRTPLTGLRVTLEAARLDVDADRDGAFDAALSEVDRLERTIDDLITLAREQPTKRVPLELSPVLTTLEADWRRRLATDGRHLRVSSDPGLPLVEVSDRALRQVLDVLVDNAWHHGAGEIRVQARNTPGGVAVEVGDDGAGINGDSTRIFERRAPDARHHGIGLALARSLAEADGLRLNLVHGGPRPIFAVFLPVRGDEDLVPRP